MVTSQEAPVALMASSSRAIILELSSLSRNIEGASNVRDDTGFLYGSYGLLMATLVGLASGQCNMYLKASASRSVLSVSQITGEK